jgi:hypothetical protein
MENYYGTVARACQADGSKNQLAVGDRTGLGRDTPPGTDD